MDAMEGSFPLSVIFCVTNARNLDSLPSRHAPIVAPSLHGRQRETDIYFTTNANSDAVDGTIES